MPIWTRTMAICALLFAAPLVEAAGPVSLTWNVPPNCPPAEAVLADVERTLGRSTNRRVAARADVTEIGPGHWSVHLVTDADGVQGERTFDANSCASLATATALILAWTVDPSKARDAPSLAPGTAVLPTTSPAPEPGAPPTRTGPAHAPSLVAVVAASGAGDVGTLPSAGASGEIAIGALLGPIRAEVAGADWVTQDATGLIRPGTLDGAHIHLFDARIRGCFRGRLGQRFELDPCLGAAILTASSYGFGSPPFAPRPGSGAWGDLQADVLAAWSLFGPLALRASVGVWIALAQPPFVVDLQTQGEPAGEVLLHKTSPVGARTTLGLEVRFP
jgi:hypothetical protein